MTGNSDRAALAALMDGGFKSMPFHPSPIARLLDVRIVAIDVAAGTATAGFTADERFLHGGGAIQGGIVAAMLDMAMALPVLADLPEDQSLATTNLGIEYLRPALPGAFEAKAATIKRGRHVTFHRADLFDANGHHVASASATNLIVGMK